MNNNRIYEFVRLDIKPNCLKISYFPSIPTLVSHNQKLHETSLQGQPDAAWDVEEQGLRHIELYKMYSHVAK